jgi:hypothetical protein
MTFADLKIYLTKLYLIVFALHLIYYHGIGKGIDELIMTMIIVVVIDNDNSKNGMSRDANAKTSTYSSLII